MHTEHSLTALPSRVQAKIRLSTNLAYGKEKCWLWIAFKNPKGYGYGYLLGRVGLMHRLVREFFIGPMPRGLVTDHLCRNRSCCNPAHMEAVTSLENTRRGNTGDAARSRAKRHCIRGHGFTLENTKWKDGRRQCITCTHMRNNTGVGRGYGKRKGKATTTHCANGHFKDAKNTRYTKTGSFQCLDCKRARQRTHAEFMRNRIVSA